MSQSDGRLLGTAKQGLHELGYTGELVQENYAFADFGAELRVRRIPLAAFGQIPTSFESAWLGVTVGPEDAQSLSRFRSLGAPQLLVLDPGSVERWKMPATGEPVLQEHFPAQRLLEVMSERKSTWGRDVVARAKSISFSAQPLQLDFYDAGLVPTIEAAVRTRLDRLLNQALARALKAHQEHLADEPDPRSLYRLIFRLLAAKLLQDRGHPGDWTAGDASEVVRRIEQYYYGSQQVPPAVSHPEVQRAVWQYMRNGFHLQNISVRTLAYIYENTLITRETRKEQSIHGTPPEIAEYVVRRLPFERLKVNERSVFEPFAGHAVFLIAALGRLRELLEPTLSDAERHDYFVRMLSGMEEEPFAIEVARLSLMLADYPNPDGWQLEERDLFAASDLSDKLASAKVVLCNPPFEDFTAEDRGRYKSVASVNQAAEILGRVMKVPPPLLGFVLPRVFRDGQGFREHRRRLVEQYGTIEITELPDRTFAHSDVETVLLLAHGENRGQVELRCATVQRQDLRQFFSTGEPTTSSSTSISTAEASAMPALWRFPLERVWDALKSHPNLSSVADVHRGIEYNVPLKANVNRLISASPRGGFAFGMVNVEDGFEPFFARPKHYVNMDPQMMRRAYELPWAKPKVIANAHRQTRGAWPLMAAPDRQGLVVYQNFHGIWSNSDWPIEVVAAVLNGYVANAFIDLREEKRHNRVKTIRAVPIPRLAKAKLGKITELVRAYGTERQALETSRSEERANHCRQMLSAIDRAVLHAYALPGEVEAELLAHFARATRPGPPQHAGDPDSAGQLALNLSERLEEHFLAIDDSGISRILEEHPSLALLINEAASHLLGFIPDGRFKLELLTDPDFGDNEQLFLGVVTGLNEDQALEALQRFDQEWWVHNARQARGILCIDLTAG